MKYLANENKFGHIEIIKDDKITLYLQYETEITEFYNSLDNNETDLICNGYEINITDNQIITDYIDANIL